MNIPRKRKRRPAANKSISILKNKDRYSQPISNLGGGQSGIMGGPSSGGLQ